MNGNLVTFPVIAARGICSRKSYADTESKYESSNGIGSQSNLFLPDHGTYNAEVGPYINAESFWDMVRITWLFTATKIEMTLIHR